MNYQRLPTIVIAYLAFLVLCVPLLAQLGSGIGALCAGFVLLFFPGYFTSLVLLKGESVAGRLGTAIGFSIAILGILEIVHTNLSLYTNTLSILGALVVWSTVMVIIAVVQKRENAALSTSGLFRLENLILAAVILFGVVTRLAYPAFVGITPYFDPLSWATRATYIVHVGHTGLPPVLFGEEWVRERSFEFIMAALSLTGNISVVDVAIWLGPIVGILTSIMLLAVLERLGVSLAGKVVALFIFSSMSPLFEVFWRTDISMMQVVGTFFLFFSLYLCSSKQPASFLSGAFILGLSMQMHILFGLYTLFIFPLVLLAYIVKRGNTTVAFTSLPLYACGLILFAFKFVVRGIPRDFAPAVIVHPLTTFAMQSVIPTAALTVKYPDPMYMLLYITPLIAALSIAGVVGILMYKQGRELPQIVFIAFIVGIFGGWVISTLYFNFNMDTAEIFKGRGVAYAQAILIPAAGLGVTMIERALQRRGALITPGKIMAAILVVFIIFTNVGGAVDTSKYHSVLEPTDFDAIRYVGEVPGSHVKLMFIAHENPTDPFKGASSSQRIYLLYSQNPSIYDSSPDPHKEIVSNDTYVLQAGIQNGIGTYNYAILSANLGARDRTTLSDYLTGNGYVMAAKFGNTIVFKS
jgi:hypothetical protein